MKSLFAEKHTRYSFVAAIIVTVDENTDCVMKIVAYLTIQGAILTPRNADNLTMISGIHYCFITMIVLFNYVYQL